MKSINLFIFTLAVTGCCGNWTVSEKKIIGSDSDTLHVYTVDNPSEERTLRDTSFFLSEKMLLSPEFRKLSDKLLSTVLANDGVGIAGPQVGILRKVVAVQRFDKTGEPFEIYPNIRIINVYGEVVPGPEGCLSVPGRRGEVGRYQDIEIRYTLLPEFKDTLERVKGFTAVIFQHECDHLKGTVYTDYLLSLSPEIED